MIKSKEREIGQRYDKQKTQTCQKEAKTKQTQNTAEENGRNNKKSRNSILVPTLRQKASNRQMEQASRIKGT